MIDQMDKDKHFTHNITNNDRDQFMLVEKVTQPGEYINIRIKDRELSKQDLVFQMYNKNKFCYTFFFALRNDKTQTFFAICKTVEEVEEMGDNNHESLIKRSSEIVVIKENPFDSKAALHEDTEEEEPEEVEEGADKPVKPKKEPTTKVAEHLKAYTQKMTFKELSSKQKDEFAAYNVHLTFEKCYDNRSNIDFIPIIYQDKSSQRSHHLIIFDAERLKVVRHTMIVSTLPLRAVQRTNEQGFHVYNLTRTSDVHDQTLGVFTNKIGIAHPSTQKVKYQVSAMFHLKEVNVEFNRRHTMLLSTQRGSVTKRRRNEVA